jgi:hypothetical protein
MPAAPTYEPILTTTLASASATFDITPIPGTFTDLILVVNGRTASGSNSAYVRFNSDTASNYSGTYLYGTGAAAGSARYTNQTLFYTDYYGYPPSAANTFNLMILNIMNYANTSMNKTLLGRSNSASTGVDGVVGLWRSNSAITTITVGCASNFQIGTSATLYGIKAA